MSSYDIRGKRVWVAGYAGMVGSAIVRRLAVEGCEMVIATRAVLNLQDQAAVRAWVSANRPNAIFMAAAKVGGILANSLQPAEFIYDNLVIQTNIIDATYQNDVEKLFFLGSSCIYPRSAPQPIAKVSLLTEPLEPTNEWYAIAKIAGIKMMQAYRLQYSCDYISVMPTTLYGPGDNLDLQSSHVLPALIRKAHEAKLAGADTLTIWGSGSPRREFLHVDDCADACVHLMKTYSESEHVNIGSGEDLTIYDLTCFVADIVGFEGAFVRDQTKPDGTPRKLMAADKLRAKEWQPRIAIREGIEATYRWLLDHEV